MSAPSLTPVAGPAKTSTVRGKVYKSASKGEGKVVVNNNNFEAACKAIAQSAPAAVAQQLGPTPPPPIPAPVTNGGQASIRAPKVMGKTSKGPRKQSGPRSVNEARLQAFLGYDRFACFDQQPECLGAEPAVVPLIAAALHKRDLSQACVWLSLCAHMCTAKFRKLIPLLATERWGVVPEEQLPSLLSIWARRANVRWELWELPTLSPGESGTISKSTSVNPAGRSVTGIWSFLRVRSTTGWHLMPLGFPDRDVVVPFEDLFPPPVPDVQPPMVEAVEAPSPEPKPLATAEEKGKGVVRPDVATSSAHDLAVPSTAGCVSQPGVSPETEAVARPATGPCPVAQSAPPVSGRFPVSGYPWADPVYDAHYPTEPWPHELAAGYPKRRTVVQPTYEGVWAPPHKGYRWVAGWWNSTNPTPATPRLLRGMPMFCSATTDQFTRYLDSVLYLPMPADTGLVSIGRRGITDGVRHATTFQVGDTLVRDGDQWTVYPDPILSTCLRVQRTGERLIDLQPVRKYLRPITSRWKRLIGEALPKTTVLSPLTEEIDPVVKMKVEYSLAVELLPNEDQANIGHARNRAAAEKWGDNCMPAHAAEQLVTACGRARRRGPVGYGGGKPFQWGYCYSCGKQLPAKRMPGRLCGCSPTPSARSIAQGDHVCRVGGIVYPGVVETVSQHPPLKEGKATFASSECFRVAP